MPVRRLLPVRRFPIKLPIPRPTGFGLVEIMVGLVIGMLAVIVVMQVFAQSEERKRASTSGGDAQTNGIIAFYQLQNDIAQAGYGFSTTRLLNCQLKWKLPSGSFISNPVSLGAVTVNPASNIVPAGDARTDTLLVIYSSDSSQPQGNRIVTPGNNNYNFAMPSVFSVGDRVVASAATCPNPLILDKVSQINASIVAVETGASGDVLYNFGRSPRILAYAIRGGSLTMCDYLANDCSLAASASNRSIWVPVASNIVSMKAVYMKDTNSTMDGIPDADGHDQVTPSSACGWGRVSAINLALVARSAQFNRDVVNAPVPAWLDDTVAPIVGDGSILGPNTAVDEPWKHYRYRVFETVIPLRNVGWMGVPTGC